MEGVHALTDVTGFGLLGDGLELARGSGLTTHIEFSKLPAWITRVRHFEPSFAQFPR